jgi:anti-sigma regulatory factor (Ser/Thr protein kinase)
MRDHRADNEGMDEQPWAQEPPPDVRGDVWQWELASVAQLPTVRAELRRHLAAFAAVDADDSLEERFLLAFEELASNGLRHGGRPVRARVVGAEGGFLIEVSDAVADRPPRPAIGRDPACGGLGLHLVARLTSTHGWLATAGRKSVWAYCR